MHIYTVAMGERKQAELNSPSPLSALLTSPHTVGSHLRGLFRNIPCIKQKMKHGNHTIMCL